MSDVLAVVAEHGEILLFLYVLADQLGVPIPAAPVLMAAGGLAAASRLSLPGAVGLGVLATLVADLVWYAIGRSRGARVLGLLCRVSLEPDSCVRRTEEVFLRHGVRFLLFAKFVPGLGTVGPPLAGMVGVGVLRFSLYSAMGAFFWAGAWMVLGYGAGQAVERVVAGPSAWRDCGRDAGSGHRRVCRGQVDPASALPPQPEDRPNLARRAEDQRHRRQAAYSRSP